MGCKIPQERVLSIPQAHPFNLLILQYNWFKNHDYGSERFLDVIDALKYNLVQHRNILKIHTRCRTFSKPAQRNTRTIVSKKRPCDCEIYTSNTRFLRERGRSCSSLLSTEAHGFYCFPKAESHYILRKTFHKSVLQSTVEGGQLNTVFYTINGGLNLFSLNEPQILNTLILNFCSSNFTRFVFLDYQ